MRKPTFCICEKKDADQLRGNREADQRLCFHYKDNTIPYFLKQNFKPLAIFCSCTAWFVSDQVGNQNVCFLTMRLNYDFAYFSIEIVNRNRNGRDSLEVHNDFDLTRAHNLCLF